MAVLSTAQYIGEVSRRLLNAEGGDRSQSSPCGTGGGKLALRLFFLYVLRFSPTVVIPRIFHTHSFIYH
jgi:hypothetical protein